MRTLRRVLLGVVVLLLLVFGFVGVTLYRSIPPLSGREPLPGLGDSVVIGFDNYGIPRIQAASDADAMMALGYLHARDRLWSMDILRRAAEGRLAEILGPGALSSDQFLRRLDIPRSARAALGIMPVGTRALLDAYVSGVNRWIEHHARPLGPEFGILRYEPEPWNAAQSMMIARLMSWDLVTSGNEMRMAEARARFGVRADALLPWYPDSGPTIVTDGAMKDGAGDAGARNDGANSAAAASFTVPALASALLASVALRNSNSWVVAGSRTASGKPILANDPHLGLRAPAVWYLAAIHSPTLKLAGSTVPGVPGVVIGRNARIAWGVTNISVDDVDFVIERLNDDSTQVMTPDGWRPVETERDSIRVRGRGAEPFVLRRTPHGPLTGNVAMRWNAHDPSDEMTAMLGVARAANWNEFLAALRGFKTPEENWVYADVDGNIGYTASGAIPVRRSGQGLVPTRGETAEGRWERYLEFDELPRVYNPAEGFIVTANNRVAPASYPHFLGSGWELPYRAMRIREMLSAGSKLTRDSVMAMQLDDLDVFARRFKALAADAAEAAGRLDLAGPLRRWDGTTGVARVEPALFYTWYRELQRLTFDDETTLRPTSAFHRMLWEGASPWFDDVRTTDIREDLAALAQRAMRAAIPLAEGRTWGEVHRTVSGHTLGTVRPLEVLLRLNVGPFERRGSPFTVNVAGFSEWQPPFINTHAASLRQVVDLADTAMSHVIITTGQSGNPLSRRYRDQAPLWLRGELLPLSWNRDASMRVLVLTKN